MRPSTSWTTADIPDLVGMTFVITGANSGLGLESAKAVAAAGASVIMACRNRDRATDALGSVSAVARADKPRLQLLDLSDLDSVRTAAEELSGSLERIDVLMNNAGVMALPERRTTQGHEMQFGTNHLGHYALTGRLLPLLLAAPAARIVTVSSQMHRIGKMEWGDLDWRDRRYMRWPAYGQSKLANLLFAFELERRARHQSTRIESLAAHPGYSSTHLQSAGPRMDGRPITARIMSFGNQLIGQSAPMGALPQLFAATSGDAIGGHYYGPNGIAESRGHPTMVRPAPSARRRDEAHRLWNVSAEMTDVSFDWSES